MTVNDRIAQFCEWYIKEKGITQKSFSESIGISASQLNSIISGRDKAGLAVIEKFLNFHPGLDANWLLKGIGEMFIQRNFVQGNKNIVDSNIHGNNAYGTVHGHMVNIEEKADFEKIIREKEIEITRQSTKDQEAQRTINDLNVKIEALQGELKSKDEVIISLYKTIDSNDKLIEANEKIIALLQKRNL